MQCTFKLEKFEDETSKTESSRISEESKNEAPHNWRSRHWTTKLKQRKLLKANTLLSVTEIGGRIAIKCSKEFLRTLNSLTSIHKVDI